MSTRTTLMMVVLLYARSSHATVDFPSTVYSVLGFSSDGKHAVYQRYEGGGANDCEMTELRVLRVSDGKKVEKVLVRAAGCQGIKEISKRTGSDLKKQLLAKYGVKAGAKLRGAGGRKGAYRALRGKGFALRWSERGKFPSLESSEGYAAKKKIWTKVSRAITWVKGKKRLVLWSVHKRINPAVVCNDGSCLGWPNPSLASGQVAPGGRAYALVLNTGEAITDGLDKDTRPLLITLEGAAHHNNGLGMRYYKKKQLQNALAHFAAAFELDPQNRYASYNLACVYARLGDAVRAVEMLRHHRKARPGGFKERVAGDKDFDPVRQSAPFKALMGR